MDQPDEVRDETSKGTVLLFSLNIVSCPIITQVLLDGQDCEAQDDPHQPQLRVRVPRQHQQAGDHTPH